MRIRFLLLLAVTLLIPMTARAQKVTTDYDHSGLLELQDLCLGKGNTGQESIDGPANSLRD
jgi:hypothetical protein